MDKKTFILICILSISVVFLSVVAPLSQAFAEETLLSSVLEDLQTDESFNPDDYPSVEADYSLSVIQIAESTADELFIYVYNPSQSEKELTATSISFSTEINDNLYYQNYDLKLLSRDGVFAKYVVQNFTVKADALRYYDISEIYRLWDESIDAPAEYGNEISEVSFPVAQLWSASTVQNKVSYEMAQTEVITITDKYVGLIRYPDGFILSPTSYTDSHFVAFSTDYNIEYLLEAQLEYHIQRKDYSPGIAGAITMEEDRNITLLYSDTGTNGQTGLFAKTYVWNRIESVNMFIANEDLTEEAVVELNNKQWVLRFVETNYSKYGSYLTCYEVSEVTILRLKFQTAGKTYNLGVVDNKQTGDGIPDNNVYPDFSVDVDNATAQIITVIITIAFFLLLGFLAIKILEWLFRAIF